MNRVRASGALDDSGCTTELSRVVELWVTTCTAMLDLASAALGRPRHATR